MVELIVGFGVITVVLMGGVSLMRQAARASDRALHDLQASFLLEEGLEAVSAIRDEAWGTLAGLTLGTDYYLAYASGAWALGTSPATIDSLFTRTVRVSGVNRDATTNDILLSGGVLDADTKQITVTVSWTDGEGSVSKTLSTYLAKL